MSAPEPPRSGGLTPPTIPEDQQVGPDLQRAIEQMVDDVANRPFSKDLSDRLATLIDLLITRGHLARSHRRLLSRIKGADISAVRLSVFQDKRAAPSSDVDCASLIHLCKGRCCAMDVSLSRQDLDEGKLQWDHFQPYLLRRDPDHGYCSYLDDHGRCGVYDERPGTCRAYDCRRDPRVWVDYEQRIPAPLPWHLVPPDERGAPPAPGVGEGEDAPGGADRGGREDGAVRPSSDG